MTRQTLDLPTADYDRLHDEVRQVARELGLSSRDLSVQRVLRVLVSRMLNDAELFASVMTEASSSVPQ